MEYLLLVMLFGLLLFTIQRNAKQRRSLATVQSSVAPGAEVMMSSGLFGTVTSIDEDRVTVEMAPGQYSTWDRRAVLKVVKAADDDAADGVAADGVATDPHASDHHDADEAPPVMTTTPQEADSAALDEPGTGDSDTSAKN